MAKIVVTEFMSLDGVIEAPGGGEKFRHGGWSFEIARGKEGDQFKVDETQRSEALLLGRATYEGFAAAWPSRTGEFADKFNRMPKYVVSTTLKRADWNNSGVLGGDVPADVARLKKTLSGDIVVHGSARLAQTLMDSQAGPRGLQSGLHCTSLFSRGTSAVRNLVHERVVRLWLSTREPGRRMAQIAPR